MIKHILFISLSIIILIASEVEVIYNYDDAINLAIKERKKVLLLIKKDSCQWCKKMINITLKDKNVQKLIKDKYILVFIDRDSSNYPIRFYSKAVPATFIIDAQKIIESEMILGYVDPERFFNIIKM